MVRPLRIEFPNAVYHVMARGNGRQVIFHEPDDYARMTEGLEKTVGRTGWQIFAWIWMPNHIHLVLKTLQPLQGNAISAQRLRELVRQTQAAQWASVSRAIVESAQTAMDINRIDKLLDRKPKTGSDPVDDFSDRSSPNVCPPHVDPAFRQMSRVDARSRADSYP